MDCTFLLSRPRFVRSSNNSPKTLVCLPQSPKIPLNLIKLAEKPKEILSFIPSLVLKKRKATVLPRVNRKYHGCCYYKRKITDDIEKLFSFC
jgi:hypothetical protein